MGKILKMQSGKNFEKYNRLYAKNNTRKKFEKYNRLYAMAPERCTETVRIHCIFYCSLILFVFCTEASPICGTYYTRVLYNIS